MHVLAKILTLVAFFVILNNVFVMRLGYRNCGTCVHVGRRDIVWSAIFLAYYFVYSMGFVFLADVSSK